MKLFSLILLFGAFTGYAFAQTPATPQAGEKSPNVHHTGDVWLSHAGMADSIFNYNVAQATFAPGARLDWHVHPGGQQLYITDGVGYYQERNKSLQVVRKGALIKCEPGVEHWHGATPDSTFTYLAMTAPQPTKWLEKVKDEDYFSIYKATANNTVEQEIIDLSKQKWQWMADKDVAHLTRLFHDKSVYVHMGGSWGKTQEVNVIQSGGIHYKKADIHEVSVSVIGNTAILLNKITLTAVVGGNEVVNPFIVTEVYVKENNRWQMGSLSFTKQVSP